LSSCPPSLKRSLRPIGLRFCDEHHFSGSGRSHCADAGGRQSLASTAWQSRSTVGRDAVTCNAGSPFRYSCRYRCNPSPDSRLAFRSAPMLILELAAEAVCDRRHSMAFLIAASPKSTVTRQTALPPFHSSSRRCRRHSRRWPRRVPLVEVGQEWGSTSRRIRGSALPAMRTSIAR
jgi:hypothetical protein